MKIQIIQLERFDDVISTRDKLTWTKTAKVLLVWPRRGRILTRRLDLVILLRTCTNLGTQLGLVTKDRGVRENAGLVGIPFFSSVAQAQRDTWHRRGPVHLEQEGKPRPDLRTLRSQVHIGWPRWLQNPWVRLGVFAAGMASVLILILSFIPSAGVIVVPRTQLQQMTLPVLVSSQIKTLNISGNLPARPISAVVEGQESIPTTGVVEIPDQYAVGVVSFTNLTDQRMIIPAGTVVQGTEGSHPRFVTTQDGQINGGSGKSIDIPIRAVLPGESGNVGAGVIQAIEGSLGLSLKVINVSPSIGGLNLRSAGASAADLNLLREKLQDDLRLSAQKEMESRLLEGDQLIPATLEVKNILDERSEPEINQPADELTLSLRLEFTAVYIAGSDMLALGLASLDLALPEGYQPMAGTLQVEGAGKPVIDHEGVISWHVSAHRMIRRSLSEDQVASLALGLPPQQAIQRLSKELPLDSTPRIVLNPAWWPRLPILPFRITVQNAK